MRFAVVDPEALLCFPRRLMDEGADVLYYVKREAKDTGTNLVPKTDSLHQLLWWAKQEPTVVFFLGGGMGKAKRDGPIEDRVPVGADDFRKAGCHVIGAGGFCDRLEGDRHFGEELAKEIGATLPPTHAFSTVSQAIAHVEAHQDESWYFKTDRYINSDATCGGQGTAFLRNLKRIRANYGDRISNIVQKKIEGVGLSTACWWNGMTFVRPFEGTIEYKKAYNGNLGPSTGCAANAVWFYPSDTPRVVTQQGWDKLGKLFFKYDAPPGIYDINSIAADDGQTYFLEWTPRMGIDAEPTSFRLWEGSSADTLWKLATGRLAEVPVSKDIAYSVRLSVPPYPFEGHKLEKGSARGTPIEGADGLWDGKFVAYAVCANDDGELEVADKLGVVGLSLATGPSLSVLHKKVIDYAEDLEIQGLGYRTDADTFLAKDAKRLRKAGFDIHTGLLT